MTVLPLLYPIVTPAKSACVKPSTSSKMFLLASVGVMVLVKSLPFMLRISTTISSVKGPSGLGVLNTGFITGKLAVFVSTQEKAIKR